MSDRPDKVDGVTTGFALDGLNPRIETEIGSLISSAQQAKRNCENWGRSEYVRWRKAKRWCGKRIARILSENA